MLKTRGVEKLDRSAVDRIPPCSLAEFLRQQRSDQGGGVASEPAIREEWLSDLNQLYELVEGWLGPEQAEGLVHLTRGQVIVIEEGLGWYDAPSLVIGAGGKTVQLHPMGRLIADTTGQVDLICDQRRLPLVRDSKHRWLVVPGGPSGRPLVNARYLLTRQSLSEALKLLLK